MKETLSNIISISVALGILSFVQEIKTEVVETNKYLVNNVFHNSNQVSYYSLGNEKIKQSILYGEFQHNLKNLENGDILLEHKKIARDIYGLRMRYYPENEFEIIKN